MEARVTGLPISRKMQDNGIVGFYLADDKLFFNDQYKGKNTMKWIGLEGEERPKLHDLAAKAIHREAAALSRLSNTALILIKYVRTFQPERINLA